MEPFFQLVVHSIVYSQTHPHMGIYKVTRAHTGKLGLGQQVAGQPSHTQTRSLKCAKERRSSLGSQYQKV